MAETEQTTDEQVVITGAVVSELPDKMKDNGFTASSVEELTSLASELLELMDERVARNDLKPEIIKIELTRKTDGSPFFTLAVVFDKTVTAEQVTTITDRAQKELDTVRKPRERRETMRAIELNDTTDKK